MQSENAAIGDHGDHGVAPTCVHNVSLLWAAVPILILACLCLADSSGTTLGLRCFSPPF